MRKLIALLLGGMVVSSIAPGGEVGGQAEASTAPNFVLILTDDQRWDTIGRCLGMFDGTDLAAGSDACMPYLQQHLVANGVTFSSGHVTTAVCCPSRASILKGQYSEHTGVLENTDLAKFDAGSTLATWLDDAGYRTGLYGKYLNGWGAAFADVPEMPPGWDSWHVLYEGPTREDYTYKDYALQEKDPGGAPSINTYHASPSDPTEPCAPDNLYITDLLCARALEFLAADPAQPFFLFLSTLAPHLPATPPSRWQGAHAAVSPPRYPNHNAAPVPNPPKWVADQPLDPTTVAKFDAQFRGMLDTNRAVDDSIQAIYQRLADDGRLSNTVFVFLSDNGLGRGEHRHGSKGCEYEECHRVPFVVMCPPAVCPQATPGRVDGSSFVLNIDIAPTFADLAGITPPIPVDGTSLVPILNNPQASWRTSFLFDDRWPGVGLLEGTMADLADGHRYKYVEFSGGKELELLDLTDDPWELQNLANDGVHGAVQAEMAAILRGGSGGGDTQPPPPPLLAGTPPDPSGPDVAFSFTDAEAGVTFECSLDGSPFVPCTSPVSYAGLADGGHAFSVQARDATGNASAATSFGWSVASGGGGGGGEPVVTMTAPLEDELLRAMAVNATWTGTDDTGIARYDLYERVGVGSPEVLRQSSLATAFKRKGVEGTTYCYRVVAVDTGGTSGSGPERCVAAPLDDTAAALMYSGPVLSMSSAKAFGGTLTVLDGAGEEANIALTGRKVGVLAQTGPSSGKLQVWVDGVLADEVDLYSSRLKQKVWVFSQVLDMGDHTLTLVWAGTKHSSSTGTAVALDGVAWIG